MMVRELYMMMLGVRVTLEGAVRDEGGGGGQGRGPGGGCVGAGLAPG